MRKRLRYFDLAKIAANQAPLSPSEREVAARLAHDPEPALTLRLDLDVALTALTPKQRAVITLFAVGHTEREIARTLRISQPAVHKLLTKARATIRKILAEGLSTPPKVPKPFGGGSAQAIGEARPSAHAGQRPARPLQKGDGGGHTEP